MGKATCHSDGCNGPVHAQGYCRPCYRRLRHSGKLQVLPQRSPLERLMSKLDRSGECWVWTGSTYRSGYGQIGTGKRGRSTVAHRFAYELLVGPIPEGLQLDHLCRNRLCCNPEHLEPVTMQVNVLRGYAHKRAQREGLCPQGLHEMSPENCYLAPNETQFRCRECRRIRVREQRRRARQQVVPVTIT